MTLIDTLAARPVVAILRGSGPQEALRVSAASVANGIRCLEVTIETAAGRNSLAALRAAYAGDDEVLVGAGTVITADDLEFAATVGADFTVSPGFDPDLCAHAAALGMLHIPGVATASEVIAATRAGARLLKAFPASSLGPEWIRAMAGPFPDVRFLATGGIDASNAPAFAAAGVVAVGVSARNDSAGVLRSLSTERALGRSADQAGSSARP